MEVSWLGDIYQLQTVGIPQAIPSKIPLEFIRRFAQEFPKKLVQVFPQELL